MYSINNEIEEFCNYLLIDKKYSNETIASYKNDLKKFNNYISNNKLNFYDLKRIHITNYIKYLKQEKLSIKTISHNISSLRSFYKYLVIDNKISIDFLKQIETPKINKILPHVLSYDEINALLNFNLNTHFDYRNKAMIELMYATGMRVSELTELKINDIDLTDDVVRTLGKGKKERIIPIGDIAIIFVKEYLNNYRSKFLKKQNTDYLFLNHHGKKITRHGFYKILKEIAKRENIQTEFSPHTLRHSFATHMLDRGADITSIKEMLGHSNLATTQIYTQISNDKVRSEYDKYFPHN